MKSSTKNVSKAVLLQFLLPISASIAGEVPGGHNGSAMLIQQKARTWMISYIQPKTSIADTVRPGTLLFTGEMKSDNRLYGTAYTFKKGCAPAPYVVVGVATPDAIYLTGASPVRRGCDVIEYDQASRNAQLVVTGSFNDILRQPAVPESTSSAIVFPNGSRPAPSVTTTPGAAYVAPPPPPRQVDAAPALPQVAPPVLVPAEPAQAASTPIAAPPKPEPVKEAEAKSTPPIAPPASKPVEKKKLQSDL